MLCSHRGLFDRPKSVTRFRSDTVNSGLLRSKWFIFAKQTKTFSTFKDRTFIKKINKRKAVVYLISGLSCFLNYTKFDKPGNSFKNVRAINFHSCVFHIYGMSSKKWHICFKVIAVTKLFRKYI